MSCTYVNWCLLACDTDGIAVSRHKIRAITPQQAAQHKKSGEHVWRGSGHLYLKTKWLMRVRSSGCSGSAYKPVFGRVVRICWLDFKSESWFQQQQVVIEVHCKLQLLDLNSVAEFAGES